MKSLHRWSVWLALASFFYACSPVAAQWQVPDHSVPIGRGAGTGFKFVSPGAAGTVFTSNGPSADPTFQPSPVSSYVSFSNRSAAIAATINSSVNALYLSGYSTDGDGGGGVYTRLASAPSPVKAWHFQSADGAWWQLSAKPVYPKQLGAKLDGATDDTVAIQAWMDYGTTFGVTSVGQYGTAVIPSASLIESSNSIIDGQKLLTLRRSTNVYAAMLSCSSKTNVTVRNLNFTSAAGITSTSTVNSALGTGKTFTVPAGLGLAVGNTLIISSTSQPWNAFGGQVTSYSGTTLVVTSYVIFGSPVTASAWNLDFYTDGATNNGNWAFQFNGCTGTTVEHNNIQGRYYAGIDIREDSSGAVINNNYIAGSVDRQIYAACVSVTCQKYQVTNNSMNGLGYGYYGIQLVGNTGGFLIDTRVNSNAIQSVVTQGISVSGDVIDATVSSNTIRMFNNSTGVGIISQPLTGVPNFITITGNTISNGAYDHLYTGCQYCVISSNIGSGSGVAGMSFQPATNNYVSQGTITGNVERGSAGSGVEFIPTVSGGVRGMSFTANNMFLNGAYGATGNVNTVDLEACANVAMSNTTAGYNLGSTTNFAQCTNK